MTGSAKSSNFFCAGETTLPFLMTTRNLILRPLLHLDSNNLSDSIKEGIKDMKMWLPWISTTPKAEDYKMITATFYREAENNEAKHVVVFHNENFIGMVSLYNIDNLDTAATLGYWFVNNKSKEILMEALRAAAQLAFEDWRLERLVIPCVAGNYFNEMAAKELSFKLNKVDLSGGQFIKIYELRAANFNQKVDLNIIHSHK